MKTFAEMSLEELQQAQRDCQELYDECMHCARQYGPIYAISDLHMGDGGPRDNFAYGDRENQLLSFLDFVDDNHGQLVICGDFFELWQSNISMVLTKRFGFSTGWRRWRPSTSWATMMPIFGTSLARAVGLPIRSSTRMCLGCHLNLAGKSFQFIHGHEADPYCSDDTPGLVALRLSTRAWPRTAMAARCLTSTDGGAESRGTHGKACQLLESASGQAGSFYGDQPQLRDMPPVADVVICGHTHRPGRIEPWHYNCGTWAERVNSFVRIHNGKVGVFDWVDGRAVPESDARSSRSRITTCVEKFLQLADTYNPDKHKIAGYLVSEKLDGTRCFWDGGLSRGIPTDHVPWASTTDPKTGQRKPKLKPTATGLWSRYGNPIMAPDDFLNALPACPLDGEFWAGRGNFQLCRSICGGDEPDPRFHRISYAVYSAPAIPYVFSSGEIKNTNMVRNLAFEEIEKWIKPRMFPGYGWVNTPATFNDELMFLREYLEAQNDRVFIHHQLRLPEDEVVARAMVNDFLDKVLEQGGEGVVIRNPLSSWIAKAAQGPVEVQAVQ